MITSFLLYLNVVDNAPRKKPAVADPVNEYLWGGGYYEQGRAHYSPPPFEPIQRWAKCAKCGRPIHPDELVAFDNLAFHDRCLSAKFLHPAEEG